MSKDKDQPIIVLAQNGNMSAYEKLVDRYKHMVFTLALRIVGNREDAEEVAQDTFLKVYSALPTFKGDSKFSTWLYKITYRKGLDFLKKQNKHPATSSLDLHFKPVSLLVTEAWNTLETKERRRTVKRGIEKLEGDDGILITLFYFEELSLMEISEITDMESNTVKVKLFRARKKLADILRNSLEPETIQGYERARK